MASLTIHDLVERIAAITDTPGAGSTRLGYSELEDSAHEFVWQNLKHIDGLVRVSDSAGNLFVVPETAVRDQTDGVLLIGSHLDTVINGGSFDGVLGVAAAISVLIEKCTDGKAHPRLGLVVFRDEEGVRFRNGLFGSRAFAGLVQEHDLDVLDHDGNRLRDLVPDAKALIDGYRPPVRPLGFLECHIEQGIKLESRDVDVGVVTGIVGIRRFEVRAVGEANHAGTTEMARRKDALVGLAGLVADLPSLVEGVEHGVITCGSLSVHPGAPNVIPGEALGVVEMRAPNAEELDLIEQRLSHAVARARDNESGVQFIVNELVRIEPMTTDSGLLHRLRSVLDDMAISSVDLPSMAGHDTQNALRVCPAAMFFIPSARGISHNPEEFSKPEHVLNAARVMNAWAESVLEEV